MDDLYDDVNNFDDDILDENDVIDNVNDIDGDILNEHDDNDKFIGLNHELFVDKELSENISENLHLDNEDDSHEEVLFNPPLYKQRYHAVAKEINKVNPKRVLDMGCSEAQFLPVIKSMCPTVEEISGVDIDQSLLERMGGRLRPLSIEYVLKRDNPLTMRLLHGSITEPSHAFIGIDFVSCIEVIEHLYPEDLAKVPDAIFGVMEPKTVAITTPNSEYNVLFKNFSGMRHWDHKFEWTRGEFEKWCFDIVNKYPYKVEFSGIGEPPEESAEVGCCSQMGLFTRQPQHPWLNIICQPEEKLDYEVIHEFIYPHDSTKRPQKILNEICYLVNRFYSNQGEETSETFDRIISMADLLDYPSISRLQTDLKEVVDILRTEKHEYNLTDDEKSLVVHFKQTDFEKDWTDEDIIVGIENEEQDNTGDDVQNVSNENVADDEECWDDY